MRVELSPELLEAWTTPRAPVVDTTSVVREAEVPDGLRWVVLSVDNNVEGAASGHGADQALANVARIFGAARDLGTPVIHLTGKPRQVSGVRSWLDVVRPNRRDPSTDEHFYSFAPGAEPLPGEVVVRKTSPSAFFDTRIRTLLHDLGVDGIVLCGQSTSGCVRATAVDAASHRLRVVVPHAAVYDPNQASHSVALYDMHRRYAQLLATDQVAQLLGAGRAGSSDA